MGCTAAGEKLLQGIDSSSCFFLNFENSFPFLCLVYLTLMAVRKHREELEELHTVLTTNSKFPAPEIKLQCLYF